jgi:hypothetical protein
MVDPDTDAALRMLEEPALMVGSHRAIKFDHAGYRKMAEPGSMVVTSFELIDVEAAFPNACCLASDERQLTCQANSGSKDSRSATAP